MNYQRCHIDEIVLFIALYVDEVYDVSVAEEYKKYRISIPAIQTVLRRLEKKGFLKSGELSPERGRRRKRLYEAPTRGLNLIHEFKNERMRLWLNIPAFRFKSLGFA